MGALETLQAKYDCQILLVESGGDNLAANYSRELADYIIYVIDVSVRPLLLNEIKSPNSFSRRVVTRSRGKGVQGSHNLIFW